VSTATQYLNEPAVSLDGLQFGPGTPYAVVEFNPFRLRARASSQPRAWNHGAWSGAEWAEEVVVPLVLTVRADRGDPDCLVTPEAEDAWAALQQALSAAWAPIGDLIGESELTFTLGSRDYVMFGRPRVVEPDTTNLWRIARTNTQLVFVALDPRKYSTPAITDSIGLSQQEGGLTVPFTVPFVVEGFLVGGVLELVNIGTAPAPLFFRIDGPVVNPRIILQRPDGSVQEIDFFDLTIPAGQWVEISTASGTVLRNGLPGSSARGQVIWDIDPFPLLPGTTTLRFVAEEFNEDALLTVTYRSAWW
jgi:hypothetical protein